MRRITALLIAGLFVASLAVPAVVIAAPPWGNVIQVQPPGHGPGADDTANIQNALNSCVGKGPNCTVQLQAGTYHSNVLVTNNFNGTFEGARGGQTTIAALPNLTINETDPWVAGECAPNLTDCRYPWFITFVNGNVEVSDLSLDFPATDGTETNLWTIGGNQYKGLFSALVFTGYGSAAASVDRVRVTGRADHTASNLLGLGFNLVYGIDFDGYYPIAPFPSMNSATRSGTFAVHDSSVQTAFEAIVMSGLFTSSQVAIGRNRINDVDFGVDVGAANSTFDIAYNSIAADNASTIEEINHGGVLVEPSGFAGLVNRLSQVSIHDNTIAVSDACGCTMVGIWLQDANQSAGASAHWFRATILHNSISLPTTSVQAGEGKEGMDVNNITGTVISGNTITGTSAGTWDAISLWGNDPTWLPATNNVVVGNDVRGLMPEGSQPYPDTNPGLGLSQYYLDPVTNHNMVVCSRRGDTAYDAGTSNAVVGCATPTLPAAAAQGVSPLMQPTSPINRFTMPRLHP